MNPLKTTLKLFIAVITFSVGISLTSAADVTYTVDNNSDTSGQACTSAAGDCSFRSAIENANNYPNSTDNIIIQFDSSLMGQTLYLLSPLTITHSNISIIGLGPDNFTIDLSSFVGGYSAVFDVTGSNSSSLISNISVSGLNLTNIVIDDNPHSNIFSMKYVDNITVDNVKFGPSSRDVVYIGQYSSNVIIENSELFSADVQEDTNGYQEGIISSYFCDIVGDPAYDFYAPENAGLRDCLMENVQILNNEFYDANQGVDIIIAGGFNVTISGNTFNDKVSATGIQGDYIVFNNTFNGDSYLDLSRLTIGYGSSGDFFIYDQDVTISDNVFNGTYIDFIVSNTADSLTIIGNTIENGYIQLEGSINGDLLIEENTISNTTSSAVINVALATVSAVDIINNIIDTAENNGIYIGNGASGTASVDDINISGNTISSISGNAVEIGEDFYLNNSLFITDNTITNVDGVAVYIAPNSLVDNDSITSEIENNELSLISGYGFYIAEDSWNSVFSGNSVTDLVSTQTVQYESSLTLLSYNGIDYINYIFGGDNILLYQNSDGSVFQPIATNNALVDASVISDAQIADGFMAILFSGNFGAGFVYVTSLVPKNAYSISDLTSCNAFMGARGTCEAFKFDYFNYDVGTEEFTWTGLSGFETAGGTVDFATGYSGPAYLNKQASLFSSAYYIATSDNTFTNETLENVDYGFIFSGTSAEDNYVYDSVIDFVVSSVVQEGTDATDTNYFYNTTFGGYAGLDIQSGIIEAYIDVQLQAYDQSGVPVEGAAVQAEDSEGIITDLGTTNSSGITGVYTLPIFVADSTGLVTDYNPYSVTITHDEFVDRNIQLLDFTEKDQEITFGYGPVFGGITVNSYTAESVMPNQATGSFSLNFTVGDAIDGVGIPVGGHILITLPDNFTMNDIANLIPNITLFTDDDTDISGNISSASLTNNVIDISITNQDIDKESVIILSVDNTVLDLNPALSGQYALEITTTDELGATLDTGYKLLDINNNVGLTVTVQEALIMTISNSLVNLIADPSVANGEDYSQKTEIIVSTNAKNGYRIQAKLQDSEGEAALKGDYGLISSGDAKSAENVFGYIAYNNIGLNELAKTIEELKLDANPVASFSNSSTALSLYNGTSNAIGLDNLTQAQKHTIYYVLNIDYITPAGLYSGVITFTAMPSF